MLQALRTDFEEHFNETYNNNNSSRNGNLNAITGSPALYEAGGPPSAGTAGTAASSSNSDLRAWEEERPPDEG